ncbi:lipid II:glycine glycyltransferase (peptidoglycan interpeptide bridge formation enzyme) [Arthrobacter sp. PvP102]|jgi:lipid II:glycine glycyltransferase (peptidoglycan interpeptide bridge formation enzyme)|uniref:lipid II:glycine glycyltransferase FemX n=1 Tax=unclassified Arthrobacter TaxID=235627 RepID=UPI001AE4E6C8|nr:MULTISPECIES: peptidoglycan bridge formation glycyltransferase FemA/FemB family protein [unclassified Arthrobacter]MBP1234698.1 lipid II:glycine glycyltransferase (peptidoglycan interpeptide bridge formation enzyme) [Arthrobacter sp. PvP103]MBP1235656.1 lipid II:glycine glycyltransferase (peptidoglycan interpeptide bridge formation enzyme) [Arthrobacter sp. PvP102]
MEYFLQTPQWADFQRSLGRTVHEQSGPGWSFLAVEEKNPAGKVLYAPYGPVAESLEAFDAALAALVALARTRGAAFVRIEPASAGFDTAESQSVLRSRGLRPAPVNQQPELSWIVDLDRDFKEVLAAMKPVNRNLYRNIHKKDVTFRASQDPDDIRVLLNFLHMTAKRSGFKPQSDEYLSQVARSLMPVGAATLFIAERHGGPIAAALAYDSADTRTYAHAALDDSHRKLSAGIPLLVTLMADAKEKGLKHVDLWGVAPEDQPNHKWAGFTAFKKSFGGREVTYPGTWDLPVKKVRYGAYQLARKAREKLRALRN